MEIFPEAMPLDVFQYRWRYKLLLLYLKRRRRKRRKAAKRWWVRPIFEARRRKGHYHNLIQEMRLGDGESFFNYFRMSPEMFDTLLNIVGPSITKVSMTREAISPAERLSVTLRYLAEGDSMANLSYQFRLGKTTVASVVNETTNALWQSLKERVFPAHNEESWKQIASVYWEKLNFPNCLGAIDGKHVVMQGSNSIVLMAACDANYCFTVVDIGVAGRQSDRSIFKNSLFGRLLEEGKLKIPPPSNLPGSQIICPYVFLGNEAFPLLTCLMRPFSGKNLTDFQRIFNYRLIRTRRIIDNAFGILTTRFRIFRRPILGSPSNIDCQIKAAVCLHNWILKTEAGNKSMYCPPGFADSENEDGKIEYGRWRIDDTPGNGIRDFEMLGSENYGKDVCDVRQKFAEYCKEYGQVPCQCDEL